MQVFGRERRRGSHQQDGGCRAERAFSSHHLPRIIAAEYKGAQWRLALTKLHETLGTAASAREAHEVDVLGKEVKWIKRSCRARLHQTYLPTRAALNTNRYFRCSKERPCPLNQRDLRLHLFTGAHASVSCHLLLDLLSLSVRQK